MESFIEKSLPDRVADEFDRLEIFYTRAREDLFVLPCRLEMGRLEVQLHTGAEELGVFVGGLFHARDAEEYKTVAYLNHRLVSFGRFGVDVADGEVTFDAEYPKPRASDFVVCFLKAWELSALAAEALGRVRLSGAAAADAVEGAIASRARDRARVEIDSVAREAWDQRS